MFVKILLLVSQVVWFYVSFTPPNSAPPPKERTGHRYSTEWYMNRILSVGGLYLMKGIIVAASLADIAVLLASKFPSHPISPWILRKLLFPPSLQMPSAMRLTLPVLAGSILITAGGVLRWWCYRTLNRFFTFHLSIRAGHNLVTTGPYVYVRHPSYTGILLSVVGGIFVLMGSGGWMWESGVLRTLVGKAAVGLWIPMMSCIAMVLVLKRPYEEDEMLKERFNKEWEEWAERVPFKVIPGLY